jgi:hypothetical protein
MRVRSEKHAGAGDVVLHTAGVHSPDGLQASHSLPIDGCTHASTAVQLDAQVFEQSANGTSAPAHRYWGCPRCRRQRLALSTTI